jgi:hypothetical protein
MSGGGKHSKKGRDYRAERLRESAERKEKRNSRGRARYAEIKKGNAHVGDGTHVDHENQNANDNSSGNTRVVSAKTNLSRKKGKNDNSTNKSGKRKKSA